MTAQNLASQTSLKTWLANQNKPIMFIPTMGSLHDGHSSLIKQAKDYFSSKNPQTLVSIFVNPLQFGPKEDFTKYPRNQRKDFHSAMQAGANAVWTPSFEDIFPEGAENHFQIKAPQKLTSKLCGIKRPGHFDGVATVVLRLLQIIKPEILILGEKDWQQLIIIRRLVEDLEIPTQIKSFPTYRDVNGMAYSSRNQYLSPTEKKNALTLSRELKSAKDLYKQEKPINIKRITSNLMQNNLDIEYLKLVDIELLEEKKYFKNICLLAAAVKCGSTRLIDHTFLMRRFPIVAIDGPAGAGKSTVSKAFAKKVGLLYLDTGAMYRAITWFIQSKGIAYDNEQKVVEAIKDCELTLETSNTGQTIVSINKKKLTDEIRSPKITEKVALIASYKTVRETLTNQQKNIGLSGGLVAEGRDIGTAVFPDAEVKIFLTATPLERAKRRALDLKSQGFDVPNLKVLEAQIKKRDHDDSNRDIAPLKQAKDAIEIITDGMGKNEVIDRLIEVFRSKIPEEVWATPEN